MSATEDSRVRPGEVATVGPLVRRVTATNPGIMTGPGTNCYLVGRKEVAVIDPGLDDPEHIERIREAAPGPIRWIVVTHTHPDHSPGSRTLARLTGAPVLAHATRLQGVRDEAFSADAHLDEGDSLEGADFTLRCLYTPGHAADHLCFLLEEENTLFAGDHVMEGTTVVIAPPDGDMRDYLASLQRLLKEPIQRIAPGHGGVIGEPGKVLQGIINHRLAREAQILSQMPESGEITIAELVRRIYTHVPESLHAMARMSVYAHLLKLRAENRVQGQGLEGVWRAKA